jgi:hypothetical protein
MACLVRVGLLYEDLLQGWVRTGCRSGLLSAQLESGRLGIHFVLCC